MHMSCLIFFTATSIQGFENRLKLQSPRELVKNTDLNLYLHIPFCKAKCNYCNFAVDTRSNENVHNTYVNTLSKLTRSWIDHMENKANRISVEGIDIGGGTPTSLSEKHLVEIMQPLQALVQRDNNTRVNPNYISIETTPSIASLEPQKMRLLHDLGINRISMGIQSTSDSMLLKVNRSQQIGMEDTAIRSLRDAGFSRVNTDIIFGLPNQGLDEFKSDLFKLVEWKPDSITTYDCLYRGKGRTMWKKNVANLPTTSIYGHMYDYAYEYLTQHGYHAQYGSVNFSLRANESGTSSYFENRLKHGRPYLGLGNYATSMIDRYWIFAPYTVNGWLDAYGVSSAQEDMIGFWPVHDAYSLPVEEMAAKQVLLSLSFGLICVDSFNRRFPSMTIDYLYGDVLQKLVEDLKWMKYEEATNTYVLREGMFHQLPKIRSLFYSRKCLKWFEDHIADKMPIVK